MAQTKYIFVTGGVASSLGKGIISSSIGKLLQARGFNITIQKFDPYINVDPGTLNPYEHGECYVTEDGAAKKIGIDVFFLTDCLINKSGKDLSAYPQGLGRLSLSLRGYEPCHNAKQVI